MTDYDAMVFCNKNAGLWKVEVQLQPQGPVQGFPVPLQKDDTLTLLLRQPHGASAEFLEVNISDVEPADPGKRPTIPGMRSNNRTNNQGQPAGPPGWWGHGPGTQRPDGVVRVQKRFGNVWSDLYEISPTTVENVACPVIKDIECQHSQDQSYFFWGTVLVKEGGVEHKPTFDPEMVNKGSG